MVADEEIVEFLEGKCAETCELEFSAERMIEIIDEMEHFDPRDTRAYYPIERQELERLAQFFGREYGKYAQELDEIVG